MQDLVIYILRLLFIILLYFFVFCVLYQMFRRLKSQAGQYKNTGQPNCLNLDEMGSELFITDGSAGGSNCARLFYRDGGYWVEDYSGTGVALNCIPVEGPVAVSPGDFLQVGGVYFAFVRWGHEVEPNHSRRESTECQ